MKYIIALLAVFCLFSCAAPRIDETGLQSGSEKMVFGIINVTFRGEDVTNKCSVLFSNGKWVKLPSDGVVMLSARPSPLRIRKLYCMAGKNVSWEFQALSVDVSPNDGATSFNKLIFSLGDPTLQDRIPPNSIARLADDLTFNLSSGFYKDIKRIEVQNIQLHEGDYDTLLKTHPVINSHIPNGQTFASVPVQGISGLSVTGRYQ